MQSKHTSFPESMTTDFSTEFPRYRHCKFHIFEMAGQVSRATETCCIRQTLTPSLVLQQSSIELVQTQQSLVTNANSRSNCENIQDTHEVDGDSQTARLLLIGPAAPPPPPLWCPRRRGVSQNQGWIDTLTYTVSYHKP
jgi:hypothetical protein